MFKKYRSTVVLAFVILAGFTFLSLPVLAQVQSVQVPFTSVGAGIAPTTYNGTTPASSVCSAAYDTFGDGCPPTQATLENNTGLTIDPSNNMYIAEDDNGTTRGPTLRVVYRGGSALAAALINANSGVAGFPSSLTPGNIYGISARTSTLTSTFCNGVSGATRLDVEGDGCLANQAYWEANQVQVDAGGNILLINDIGSFVGYNSIKVIYVGGGTSAQNAAVINLIKSYTPNAAVTTPCSGCIYELSNSSSLTQRDFIAAADIAIDANENLYVADAGANATVTGELATNSGNQIKKYVSSPTAGWVTYIPSGTASPTTADGDGGLPAAASVNLPLQIQADANGNLYISDSGNVRFRVVYNSAGIGTLPPVYVENGTTPTAVSSPVAGDIYTVAGGQPSSGARVSGSSASMLYTGTSGPYFGLDQAGNLYVYNRTYDPTFAINRITGIAQLIAGVGGSTTTGALGTPGPGAFCNGGTSGPTMTDGYGSGCPATQVNGTSVYGHLSFDSSGNLYMNEKHSANSFVGIIRKYGFTNQFGSVTAGSSSTQAIAFSPLGTNTVYTTTPTPSLVNSAGTVSADFTDAGGDACVVTNFVQTCVYNVKLTPAAVGTRLGRLTLTYSGSSIATTSVGGIGGGAQISLDPATQTTIGTGLTPAGVAVDQSGNFYIADSATNKIFKSTAGGAPVSFATGFNKPTQVAVSGGGTVYVADSGNNRIAAATQAGVVSALSLTNGAVPYTLSNPSGVAVDPAGNIYIADTGNNRVIAVTGSVIPNGEVTVLGFTGLSSPLGLAVDAAGDVFVADSGNARIVELSAAGVQSVVSVSPSLSNPVGVSVDPAGNLYIADSGNQNVVLVPNGTTIATTLQGNIAGLVGLAVDNTGDTLIAASGAGGALELNRTQPSYTYPITAVGSTSSLIPVMLTNTGNATLTTGSSLDSGTDTTDFLIAAASSNGCTTSESLTAGQQCALSTTFQPQSAAVLTDTITFPTSNALNIAKATLTGTGAQGGATSTTALLIPTTTVVAGQSVSMTAAVTLSAGTAAGSISFFDGSTLLGSATLSSGSASYSTTLLSVGTHSITATYGGQTGISSGSSSTATVVAVTAASTIWVANGNGTLSAFSNSGVAISTSSGYSGGGSGIAIGIAANVWSGTASGTTMTRFSKEGALEGSYTGAGGVNSPVSVAIDGAGSVWIANSNSTVSKLTSGGTALSPSTGFAGSGLSTPSAVAIDGSGNVWVTNSGDSSLTEFFGAGSPAVTPLATAVANGTQGTTP